MSVRGGRIALGIAGAVLLLGSGACLAAGSVRADALYPASSAGTWDIGQYCDDQSWTRTYSLWYILDGVQSYPFDLPNPDLAAGTDVTVRLAPVVVGSLHGRVSLAGPSVISGHIPEVNPHPGDTIWQDVVSGQTFSLSYEPGAVTTGRAPVPDEWKDAYEGFAALEAVISTDGGPQSSIVMLAQPFRLCAASLPSPPATFTSSGGGDTDNGGYWRLALLGGVSALVARLLWVGRLVARS